MKIRNHRKLEWVLYPNKKSNLNRYYSFKYKSKLMAFIEANAADCIGGIITLHQETFKSSGSVREWLVWFNEYQYFNKGAKLKIELRQRDFRGSKYIFKPSKISKEDKKYFAFSDKVMNLMIQISESEHISSNQAKNLVKLFYKRGFKDFVPDQEQQSYIDSYLEKGIDFFHWSDRCNFLRVKTILEFFKSKNLL